MKVLDTLKALQAKSKTDLAADQEAYCAEASLWPPSCSALAVALLAVCDEKSSSGT